MNNTRVWSTIYFIIQIIRVIAHNMTEENTMYEIMAFSERDRIYLYFMHTERNFYTFLNGVTNEAGIPMTVAVRKDHINILENLLISNGLQYDLVQSASNPESNIKSHQPPQWELFLEDIEKLIIKYSPQLTKRVIGHTFENREIFVLKLSGSRSNKYSVFILGGEEGRDWSSSVIIMNLLNGILEGSTNLEEEIFENYNFYFCPLLNPDGYEYSITTDRLWAKNRKIFLSATDCVHVADGIGVSIDRNWFRPHGGHPDSHCNLINMGQQSLSSEEAQALSNYLSSIAPQMMAFINIKGFGNMITIPYADKNYYARNLPLLLEVLGSAFETLPTRFARTFVIGHTASLLYNYTGNCADWVKRELNIPVVYTIYMQSGDEVEPTTRQLNALGRDLGQLLNEVLIVTNDIYGPLFDSCGKVCVNTTMIVVAIITILIYVPRYSMFILNK